MSELARVARRHANQQTDRFAAVPRNLRVLATVTAVDGSAVTVTWRGSTLLAAASNRSGTFVVGDRVVCDVIGDQLIVDYATG